LKQAVEQHKGKNWKKISEAAFHGAKSDVQCPWTKEEDQLVVDLVRVHGPKKWSLIASQLPGRIGKQARERSVSGHMLKVLSADVSNAVPVP